MLGVLNDSEIRRLSVDTPEPLVSSFEEGNLTPNGYDLTIQAVLIGGATYTSGYVVLGPGETALVQISERLTLGNQCGLLRLRSTYARVGLTGSFGFIDAGYQGHLGTRITNVGVHQVPLVIGSTIVQIMFLEMVGPVERDYASRSGTFQNQPMGLEALEKKCVDRLWGSTEGLSRAN